VLTPDTLNAAVRYYWRTIAIIVLPTVLGLLLLQPFTSRLAAYLASIGLKLLSTSIIVAPILVIVGPMMAAIFYVQRRTLPRCPRCAKLIRPNQIARVITTRNCANCGEQILAVQS
jgi:hypothetical protein